MQYEPDPRARLKVVFLTPIPRSICLIQLKPIRAGWIRSSSRADPIVLDPAHYQGLAKPLLGERSSQDNHT